MAADASAEPATRAEFEKLSMFAAADLDALGPVLRGCPVRSLQAGEVLIALGSENRQLFLVLSGELGIHLETPQTPALTKLGVGETVGEIALIDQKPASAFVVAAETTRVLVLDEELLWILADSSHAVAYNLLRTLASRMRAGNAIIQHDRKLMEEYRFHSSVDALTGLFNRYFLDKMLPRQMARSRHFEPLSLLLIDVDLFKQWNDRHGHLAGDFALRAVADRMRGVVRPTDLIARYGGEEFAVLLIGTGSDKACDVAERLRAAVCAEGIENFEGTALGTVTVSIGVAEMSKNITTPENFIEAADRALYRAKHAGRNRVER